MHLFRMVFGWYIKASIHVSLALISMVAFTGLVFGMEVSHHYLLALFFGSIAGYNGIKYGLEPGKHSYRVPGGVSALVLISLLCLVVAFYHLSYLPPHVWVLLLVCGGITALYAVPVMPGLRNLRSRGVLKVVLVALVWTLASLWIPVWGSPGAGDWDLWVETFQRLLWVSLLMLPFEIRDMHLDPPHLRTIPQRWGIGATRMLAWAGVLLFAGATWLKDSPASGELLCKSIVGLWMGFSVTFARERQQRY
ncbi:MAG: hypothetical protein P8Z38_01500, partial [Robiginitalea sp.]